MHAPQHLLFFFFNHTATTEIYTLSLHDALPISVIPPAALPAPAPTARPRAASRPGEYRSPTGRHRAADRKSTRLNSSHSQISYAVFCLKKKKNTTRSSSTIHSHSHHSRYRCDTL